MAGSPQTERVRQLSRVLKHWHKPSSRGVKPGRLGLDWMAAQHPPSTNYTEAVRREVADWLERLIAYDPLGADILQKRFIDQQTVAAVAHRVGLSVDQVNRRQREAIEQLAEIAEAREQQTCREFRIRQEVQLPPPSYTRLFGVEKLLQKIEIWLMVDAGPTAMVLSGMGGVGKTALADAIARTMLDTTHFVEVIWLRYTDTVNSQEWLLKELEARILADVSQPATVLAQEIGLLICSLPYMVVIDEVDARPELAALLHQVEAWPGPSRFLFTSRASPLGRGRSGLLRVPELDAENAVALVVAQAEEIGLGLSLRAAEELAGRFYEMAGGNPLALRLMVSLLLAFPAEQVLAGMEAASLKNLEEMYAHIFQTAWAALEESAQRLLQAMALAAESGATLTQIQAVTGLEDEQLNYAIEALYERSLLEFRGSSENRRYGIHRLTETFLRNAFLAG